MDFDLLGLQDTIPGNPFAMSKPAKMTAGCLIGTGVIVGGAAVLCSPSGPGEAACIPGAFVVAGAVLGCGVGAAAANSTSNSGSFAFHQSLTEVCPKGATDKEDRQNECNQQFFSDTQWCDRNYKGDENFACHQWADAELWRCIQRLPPEPFRL